MQTKIFSSLLLAVIFVISSFTAKAQDNTTSTIEVIQFHSEHRCMTCNKIEALTKETLKSYPKTTFRLVNVDEEKNEKMAEQFEATGTALFLYNPATKKKKDLTDFAFMNAGDREKFVAGLKKHISGFSK